MAGSRVQARLGRGAAVVVALATLGGVSASAFGYTVRSGDTVSALAMRFGVAPRDLVAANHLADPNLIYAGHALVIPAGPTPTATGPIVPGSSLGVGRAVRAASFPPMTRAASAASSPTVTRLPFASSPPVTRAPSPASSPPVTSLPLAASSPTATTTTVAPSDPRSPGPLAPVAVPPSGPPTYPSDLLARPSRLVLVPIFRYWARMYGISAGLLESVGWMESGWQTTAVSRTGAIGVCQIEPSTATFVSSQLLSSSTTLDATLPDPNIHMAAAYLSWLLQKTHGDVAMALGGYYQGLIDLVAKGPRVSTRRYVSGVGALWALFRSG